MKPSLLLSVKNITIRLKDKFLFEHTSWELKKHEQWLIMGENGAGKTIFAKALAGLLPLKNGAIKLHFIKSRHPYPALHKDKIVYLSFDTEQHRIAKVEQELDFQSFVGRVEKGTTVGDFLTNSNIRSLSSWLVQDLSSLKAQELSTLSTGELRKVFLIKALDSNPKIFILDEPFEGLDEDSKQELKQVIQNISKKTSIILITHNTNEIPEIITHVLEVKNGKIENQGMKNTFKSYFVSFTSPSRERVRVRGTQETKTQTIIEMKNVTVKYKGRKILDSISWFVKSGENWAILGPNGAGKSTLIKLITGDSVQSYSNDITLFGKSREEWPLWELKKNIGIVSHDVMMNYRQNIQAFDVIVSGFYDSIGLFKKASKTQIQQAKRWIKKLGLEELINKNFQDLSFGQKRMILIVRAVVKSPRLLILDEPCHGLDTKNKQLVLSEINRIGKSHTQIILITHNKTEIVPCIQKMLKLKNGKIEV